MRVCMSLCARVSDCLMTYSLFLTKFYFPVCYGLQVVVTVAVIYNWFFVILRIAFEDMREYVSSS